MPLSSSVQGMTSPLSVAPMMDRTDRHFRMLLRQITRRTLLYTEMITTGAILHGDRERHLGFDPAERPLALQLGGDDPHAMARCARIAEDWGYDEVNINVGCPSERVQSGGFGAALMARPEDVAAVVTAMKKSTAQPVTVKHRIGIDNQASYEFMKGFVDRVINAGADRVTVHARIAWLSGLNPKENRTVPPLRYNDVYRLKQELGGFPVEINGGVRDLNEARLHLGHVDAVMIGRAAWDDPYILADADPLFFGDTSRPSSRRDVAERMFDYSLSRVERGASAQPVLRRMLNLFAGQPGARRWRRILTEAAASSRPLDRLDDALSAVEHPVTRPNHDPREVQQVKSA